METAFACCMQRDKRRMACETTAAKMTTIFLCSKVRRTLDQNSNKYRKQYREQKQERRHHLKPDPDKNSPKPITNRITKPSRRRFNLESYLIRSFALFSRFVFVDIEVFLVTFFFGLAVDVSVGTNRTTLTKTKNITTFLIT